MSNAALFATTVRNVVTVMAQHTDLSASLLATWFDRGYSGTLTDADIASSGLTVAQLVDAIVLFEQLSKFTGNEAVATGDYGATMNRLRSDR